MSRRLTRRDAVAALVAAGVGAGAGAELLARDDERVAEDREESARSLDDDEVDTLVALGETVYPSEVTGVRSFVERYVDGVVRDSSARESGIRASLGYLDDYARSWHGETFASLDLDGRRSVLESMSADEADPDPDGSDVERLRHYLLNELLFALYSSPTGGRLVGIENPPGHPGGLASYRKGPED